MASPRSIRALQGACFLATAAGVLLAVAGMLALSLPAIAAGAVLWTVGLSAWEIGSGRFRG